MNTNDLESLIRTILTEQLTPVTAPASSAIFASVDEAINAAHSAFLRYQQSPMKTRSAIIRAIREQLKPQLVSLSERGASETGMGNKEDKFLKNKAALENTPGIEDLSTTALTGDGGMVLFEYSPFGVIGSVTPSTNPTETIINNSISMLAAGNAVYFSPHPGAKAVSLGLIAQIEAIIFNSCGIRNLVVTVKEPSFEATQQMMAHDKIALLAITGGPAIVAMAMKSGKKVIGAGNPPCLVDETAELVKAAQDIVAGASFDHNLPCIAEKSLIVVESVADRLLQQMQAFDALLISNPQEIGSLRKACLTPQGHANKNLVGKSPIELLKAAGITCPAKAPRLLLVEVAGDDPLVTTEQLMPLLPVVRVKDFDAALTLALHVEGSLHHTATMHSQNVSRLNLAARLLQTSIFVKNGPSYAGIGVGGEGFTTFTIATPTGEGTTSARTFARQRRCVLTNGFSIR
ncbi:TPA: aldehyde dehydrogenase EutE [Yersinia enterocolitica]|nr:aldehyde dehydrogenase EutE [Yersinia enterocolitica]HDL6877182.1 aldehyde dehydrogenase EutE [Yersinia enterocolitica]HDL7081237.1 aldehyde dehydrogenase EutE [Yersinia enterocolitica]HDL7119745.1 aldehyde dehydrogenase EutE [Yersinia enterocolitica]